MNDASKTLFKATGNKLFFRKVNILIPKTWKTIPVDQAAITEVYEVRTLAGHLYRALPNQKSESGDICHLLFQGNCHWLELPVTSR